MNGDDDALAMVVFVGRMMVNQTVKETIGRGASHHYLSMDTLVDGDGFMENDPGELWGNTRDSLERHTRDSWSDHRTISVYHRGKDIR